MSIHAGKRWVWNTACQNNPGNEPPFGKILAYDSRIEGIYVNGTGKWASGTTGWSFEDPFVTPALMTRIRSFGLLAGDWFVPRTTNALLEANKAAEMVARLNPDCVMLDVETHDLAFQRAFVAEYRRLKPGRATDVTFEPRQEPEWVDAQGKQHGTVAHKTYLSNRMDLFPQLYKDDMRPADAKRELHYWSAFGWDKVHLFLNAAQDWWQLDDGALFTAETLPDKRKALTRALARVAPKRAHDNLTVTFHGPIEALDGPRAFALQPCGEEPLEQAA